MIGSTAGVRLIFGSTARVSLLIGSNAGVSRTFGSTASVPLLIGSTAKISRLGLVEDQISLILQAMVNTTDFLDIKFENPDKYLSFK